MRAPGTPRPPPAPSKEVLGRYVAACRLMDKNRLAESEDALRALLADMRGVDPLGVRYALAGLSTVHGRTGRHFEALALLRHLTDTGIAEGDLSRAANTLTNFCTLYQDLLPSVDLDRSIQRLQGLLGKVPEDQSTLAREDVHLVLARDAIRRGDIEAARRHVDDFDGARTRDKRPWRKPCMALTTRAMIALEAREPAAAKDFLRRAHETGVTCEGHHMTLALHTLRADRMANDGGALAESTRHAASLLRAAAANPSLASARIRLGLEIAECVAGLPDGEDRAHEAYDLVAAAILQRIHQLDGAVKELPELGLDDGAPNRELVRIRKSFVTQHREILERVARFLEATGRTTADLIGRRASDDFIRICAWCERVQPASGAWLPIGHFVPRGDETDITHTICPACRDQFEGTAQSLAS